MSSRRPGEGSPGCKYNNPLISVSMVGADCHSDGLGRGGPRLITNPSRSN
jgi:hypothetical protein